MLLLLCVFSRVSDLDSVLSLSLCVCVFSRDCITLVYIVVVCV